MRIRARVEALRTHGPLMSGSGFTERVAVACARRPWLTVCVWVAALTACVAVYFLWGDVFTSSSKFLNEPDSKRAADLIAEHGGGSVAAQTGDAVQSLADGIGAAEEGAGRLARGSDRLDDGTRALKRGLRKLAGGATEVGAGTRDTSAGTSRLSEGIAGASAGASGLAAGLDQVGGATDAFGAGLLRLTAGGAELVTAVERLSAGARDLSAGAEQTAAGVDQAASAAGQLRSGAESLTSLVDTYLQAHPEAADDATYQQIVGLAAQLAAGSGELATGLQSAAQGASAVSSGAGELAAGARRLAAGARDLQGGLEKSANGAARLGESLDELSSGSASLAGGLSTAAASSRALAAGSRQLAEGSSGVAEGVRSAARGADEVAEGSGGLTTGAKKLRTGLASAAEGAGQLTEALSSAGSLTDNDSEIVVVHSDALTVDDPAFEQMVLDLRDQIAALPETDVVAVTSIYDEDLDAAVAAALTSEDRHTTLLTVELASPPDEAANHVGDLYDIVTEADAKPGFEVAVTGQAAFSLDAQRLAVSDLERGEAVGVPVALVILIVVFGTLVAAGVPLVLSIFSIVVGLALTVAFGHLFDVSVFALNVLTAMGLAVGIDYSLFIVSRFREERNAGRDKHDAIAAAAATASNAVFFSGMTVVLALVGMLIVPLSIFTSLGLGAMCAVFAAVAAALTLLPAILSLVGDRIDALPVPLLHRTMHAPGREGWWGRAAKTTMRRPAISLALGVVLLLAIAAPMLFMRSGGFSAASFPDTYSSKKGLIMLQRDFAAGMSQPVVVAVDADLGDESVQEALQELSGRRGRRRPLHAHRRADQRRRHPGGGAPRAGRRGDD